MLTLPEIRVGEPIGHEALTVFPLYSSPDQVVEYQLSDEAIAAGLVTVEEVNEGGEVPYLLVTNTADSLVLFLEGEELRGAKQNRVLNTSVLVAAGAKTKIPVSCVEAGRWRYESKQFSHSGSHSSPKLRGRLKESVRESLSRGEGHRSDQGAVWKEVGRQGEALGAESATDAMSAAFELHSDSIDKFRGSLPYPENATGLVVAIGSQIVAFDLFDKPATCRKVWDRLLSGVVMDALESGASESAAGAADVQAFLSQLRSAAWKSVPAAGQGEEFRADSIPSVHASSLTLGTSLIHGSAIAANP
jgi:hypothetical protein